MAGHARDGCLEWVVSMDRLVVFSRAIWRLWKFRFRAQDWVGIEVFGHSTNLRLSRSWRRGKVDFAI